MKVISLHFKSSLKIGQLHKYSRGHQLSSYDHHTYYEQNYLTPKDIIWEKLVEGDIQSGAHLWGSILNTIAPGTQTLKPIATIDREGLIFMAVDTQVRTSSGLVAIQLLSLATDDHIYGVERRRITAPGTMFIILNKVYFRWTAAILLHNHQCYVMIYIIHCGIMCKVLKS